MSNRGYMDSNRPTAAPQSGKAQILHNMYVNGVRAHQAGKLEEAKNLYLQVLEKDIKHAESLHALGLVACQLGSQEVAANMIRRAIAVDGGRADYHASLGAVLKELGRFDESLTAYDQSLAIKPNNEEAHFQIATMLRLQGRLEDAKAHYQRAFELSPDRADTQHNLGVVHQAQGNIEEAKACYHHALRMDANFAPAYVNLGTILFGSGEFESAAANFQRALQLDAAFVEAHNGLGAALLEMNQAEEAIACHERALALRPNDARAWSNLGNALRRQGRFDEAKEKYERALSFDPALAEAHSNLGNILQNQRKLDEARRHFYQALLIDPKFVDAQWNLGLLDLLQGDLAAGWKGMEARHRRPKIAPRSFPQPQWKGEPLAGKTILLHCEQGLGDTIQFLRYVPLVEAMGARVVLDVPGELRRLAIEISDLVTVTVRGEALPDFDVHCPLMSLPLAFRTTLDSVPNQSPYLTAPKEALQAVRALLGPADGKLRVGISWSGNPKHVEDRFRSVPLELFAPLLREDRARFYSLQIDGASTQLASVQTSVVDLKPVIRDFADTAAIVTELDLVLTVDTSVAHLAGAMGRPTWVLVPFAPDWRWLTERTESPWYPSMRLFRQPAFRDWQSVMNTVHDELKHRLDSPQATA